MAAGNEPVRVAAAISLTDALTAVAAAYKAEGHGDVLFTFGSSGQLQAQIENGAPLDAFVSASPAQVDALVRKKLADTSSVRVIACNRLVLVLPADAQSPAAGFRELVNPRYRRVAIGEPATVPAGQYATQALGNLGLMEALKTRLVYGANVRQVLDYVERGEVDAGIVYATDARESGRRVRVVAFAEPGTHDPIEYPGVVVSNSPRSSAARRFLDYLGADVAREILARKGFDPVPCPQAPRAGAAPAETGTTGMWGSLLLSVGVALMSTVLVAATGVPLAYFMARRRFRGRTVLEALLTVPLVLPPTVVGYLIIVTAGARGWAGGWLHRATGYSIMFRVEGAVLAAAVVALPMLYLPARAAFAAVEKEMEDVATLMGAGRLATFWHVSLPLARRGIAAGLILAFARSLGEFGATAMVLGIQPDRMTLPISVWVDYEHRNLGHAGGAVFALTAVSLALIMAYNASSVSRQE
jgi:molybdenum ABC transporter molybdate-binding protein/molybdate ABC transporter permease protein